VEKRYVPPEMLRRKTRPGGNAVVHRHGSLQVPAMGGHKHPQHINNTIEERQKKGRSVRKGWFRASHHAQGDKEGGGVNLKISWIRQRIPRKKKGSEYCRTSSEERTFEIVGREINVCCPALQNPTSTRSGKEQQKTAAKGGATKKILVNSAVSRREKR